MSETKQATIHPSQIIKSHEANYAVFRAKTEKEVYQKIQDALRNSPYLTGYYSVDDFGLTKLGIYHSGTQRNVKSAPEQIELSPADIAQFFSKGILSGAVNQASLPEAIIQVLTEANCDRYMVFPVEQDVVTLGIILVGATPDQPLENESTSPLVHLADTIPVALANVKAAHAIQQRLRELEAISEAGQTMSSVNDLKSLYDILHQKIETTIGKVSFAIALYNPQTESIQIPFAEEGKRTVSYDPFPLGEGLISILIRTRQPLMIVEDTERRMRALGVKAVSQSAKSWMGCPLIVGGEAIGALVVQEFKQEGRFTQDDLRLIISLSAQAAGAIYNIRLLEEERQRAVRLQTVAEISREVSSSLIVDNLLQQAVDLVRERFDFYHAAVFLLDQLDEFAVIREATGEAGAQMKRAGHKLAVGSHSIVGYVTKNKEPLVVNETSSDPNYYANPLLPETKAEACLPLLVGERVLGVLDVQSTHPYAFSEENTKILQILADQLAVAVVNSELFAEAQERLSQHRLLHHVTTAAASSTSIEEALNSAVQGLQVTLGGDQIAILLADKEQKTLEVRSSIGYPNEESAKLKIPFGVGITGWVAEHRLALRVNDTTKDSRYIAVNAKVRSELAIPLIYRNEVLGVLNVESPRTNAYSENDEEMLGTLAGSLAAIIAHSRLLEQFREQVERERLLYEITSKIRRTTSPDKILSIAADELSRSLGVRSAHIAVNIDESNPGKSR